MLKILVFACFVLIYANPDQYGVTVRKPQITPSVEELLIQEGDELRLSCQGDGRLQFTAPSYIQSKVTQSSFTDLFDEGSSTCTFIRPKTIKEDAGWYACAEKNISIVNDEQTIDHPEEDISWIYVYVNSSSPFVTEVDGTHEIYDWSGKRTVIPCRTTSPNLPVSLLVFIDIWQLEEADYDPKIGFITNEFRNKQGSFYYQCKIDGADEENTYLWPKYLLYTTEKILRNPIIEKNTLRHNMVWGENLTLNCSVEVPRQKKITLIWRVSESENSGRPKISHDLELQKQLVLKTSRGPFDTWKALLLLKNVSQADDGEYICVAEDADGNRTQSSVTIKFLDPSHKFINVNGMREMSEYEGGSVKWTITIDTYPDIDKLYWYNLNGTRINDTKEGPKYKHRQNGRYHSFLISNLFIEDSGNYTIHVSTSHKETGITLPLRVLKTKPKVDIQVTWSYFTPGQSDEVVCSIYSRHLPNVTWSYKEYPDFPSKENIVYSSRLNIPREEFSNSQFGLSRLHSRLNITINMTGDLVCSSCDVNGCAETTKQILVSDVAERFGVVGPDTVTEGDDVNVTCGASVYHFTRRITWRKSGISPAISNRERTRVTETQTKFTLQSVLQIRNVSTFDDGIYDCQATNMTYDIESILHRLVVKEQLPPKFTERNRYKPQMLIDLKRDKSQTVSLECWVDGRPIPKVTWRKNNELLVEGDRYTLSQKNSVLEIKDFSASDSGRYTCSATNRVGEVQRYIDIKIAGADWLAVIWPSVIVAVVLLLIMIAWMSYRKRREMAARRRFMEATLELFNAGALDCLDPELNMAEQAELLPYNKKWEFPRELLKFGKELGSGAFGVVRMAEVKSIRPSEAVTTVAVKVVRSTANLDQMTALQRELKILAYLGKHLNVVNLLGACTKNVPFGQLFVIVEFCRFGNLRDYLVRHRADFVDEAVNLTDDIDAESSHSQDLDTVDDNVVSRVSCDMNTASAVFHRGTDFTDQSTVVDDRIRKPDPLEQNRRINYQGDYADENSEPISTRDLLSWAWQVARGMKFLGLRRILHGDLAARNILLADHNVVKICDFGLAKALFTDDNYQQKGNGPLPFKWMAVESLKDRVFSVHSDVWSYGVVLWEFYSLGKTPYSGIRPETLCEKLGEGFRMSRPEHATSEIYQMMLHCWNSEPFQRPSFAKLVEDISQLLEDSVKTHYFDLDASYVRMTADTLEHGEPDYLTMRTSEVIPNPNAQARYEDDDLPIQLPLPFDLDENLSPRHTLDSDCSSLIS